MKRRGFLRLLGGALTILGMVGLPAAILAPVRVWFGNGTDGDVTIRDTVSLDRDLHCRNLSIEGGGRLIMNGYRVYVQGTLTLGAGSLVSYEKR
jgi:hypothetical protein